MAEHDDINDTDFLSVHDWVDTLDLLQKDIGELFLIWRDERVNRALGEVKALKGGFSAAYNNYTRPLTARQQEAWRLADEAVELGINPAKHIANRLQIGLSPAYKLLRRIKGKMDKSGDGLVLLNRGSIVQQSWYPSHEDIETRMISKPKLCVSGLSEQCQRVIRNTRTFLCFPCHQLTPVHRLDEKEFDNTRDWLRKALNQARVAHRKACIEELFLEHHGSISIDDLTDTDTPTGLL